MTMMILGMCISYLLGSIPFGFLLTRIAGHGDIRDHGSGNIGATNVMRKGGKALGIATLLLDASKGGLSIWLAHYYGAHFSPLWFGLIAMLGHMFPVWLKFKGGKGVATAAGVALVFSPMLAAIGGVIFIVFMVVFGYVSLASLVAINSVALIGLVLFEGMTALPLVFMALLVTWCHRQNIKRICQKTEPKFKKNK